MNDQDIQEIDLRKAIRNYIENEKNSDEMFVEIIVQEFGDAEMLRDEIGDLIIWRGKMVLLQDKWQ